MKIEIYEENKEIQKLLLVAWPSKNKIYGVIYYAWKELKVTSKWMLFNDNNFIEKFIFNDTNRFFEFRVIFFFYLSKEACSLGMIEKRTLFWKNNIGNKLYFIIID